MTGPTNILDGTALLGSTSRGSVSASATSSPAVAPRELYSLPDLRLDDLLREMRYVPARSFDVSKLGGNALVALAAPFSPVSTLAAVAHARPATRAGTSHSTSPSSRPRTRAGHSHSDTGKPFASVGHLGLASVVEAGAGVDDDAGVGSVRVCVCTSACNRVRCTLELLL